MLKADLRKPAPCITQRVSLKSIADQLIRWACFLRQEPWKPRSLSGNQRCKAPGDSCRNPWNSIPCYKSA